MNEFYLESSGLYTREWRNQIRELKAIMEESRITYVRIMEESRICLTRTEFFWILYFKSLFSLESYYLGLPKQLFVI